MTLVFGYGSLIQDSSRLHTVPSAHEAWPVEVQGLVRHWNAQTGVAGFSTTYLGVREDKNFSCNGVAFLANDQEVEALIRRERKYDQKHLPSSCITWLTQKPSNIPESILVFCFESQLLPSAQYPIVQSYVDICLTGTLAVDRTLETTDWPFTRSFIRTTIGWSPHWVNDRMFPRVPHRNCPEAYTIDQILFEELPNEFSAIRIE